MTTCNSIYTQRADVDRDHSLNVHQESSATQYSVMKPPFCHEYLKNCTAVQYRCNTLCCSNTVLYLVLLLFGKLLLCSDSDQPLQAPAVQHSPDQLLPVESSGCSILILLEQAPLLPGCHGLPQALQALFSPVIRHKKSLGILCNQEGMWKHRSMLESLLAKTYRIPVADRH